MKLLNGTIVLSPNKDVNHFRLYFNEDGVNTGGNHKMEEMVIYQGVGHVGIAKALRQFADRIENM